MMNCEETRRAFSLYLDGEATREASAAVDGHLDACPVCRLELEETRSMLRGLAMVERPVPPADLTASINQTLNIERAARRARPSLPLRLRFTRWLEPHLMPYTVGAFYSLLLFIAVFGAVRGQLTALRNLAEASRLELEAPQIATLTGAPEDYDVRRRISPEVYVSTQTIGSAQSPRLNPNGALAALAWSPPANGVPDDDSMIVIADVYGNGSASLAGVVDPPRNPRTLDALQAALRKNPAYVPASRDRRPQTMRVVFVLTKRAGQELSY